MPNMVITGASGFIGQELVKHFEDTYDVYAPSVDILDREQWAWTLKNLKPTVFIHLAALTEVAHSFDNWHKVSRVNYEGAINMAELNRLHNPKLRRFVFSSTMETYGFHKYPNGPFNEHTDQFPNAPYAIAKVGAERYLEYMGRSYDFPYTILRQTNTYGRKDNSFFVVEKIITQIILAQQGAIEKVRLGDPLPVRNFLHIDDLVRLYQAVIEKKAAIQETFVTGPPNGLPIEHLYRLIAEMMDYDGPVVWNTMPARPGEIYYLNSDGAKARELLDWEPLVSLEEGLARTIEHWRAEYSVAV